MTNLPKLYNGLIEVSSRLSILFHAFPASRFTIEEVRLLDFFLIFPGDLGAPVNVHPVNSGRSSQFDVREGAVQASLKYLTDLGCLTHYEGRYSLRRSTEVEHRVEPHHCILEASAEWLAQIHQDLGDKAFFGKMRNRIEALRGLLMQLPASPDRFYGLRDAYKSDLRRLEFIQNSAEHFWALHRSAESQSPDSFDDDWYKDIVIEAERDSLKVEANLRGLEQLLNEDLVADVRH